MNKIISFVFFLLLVNASLSLDTCELCVDFVDNSLNNILNIILNSGVIGGCSDICSKLPNNIMADGCDLLCDYIGVDEFVKLISEEDPDPLYICEIGDKICLTNDNAAASLDLVQINPINGSVGATFTISVAYTVTNTIATGQVAFNIIDPTGNSFGDASLLVEQTPEQYTLQLQFQATPSEQESFPSGEYQLQVAVCEGSCGSPHPHSFTLAQGTTNFTISGTDSSQSSAFTGSSFSGQSSQVSGGATGTGEVFF